MDDHHRKTGVRLTYASLSTRTGISVETLQSIAVRPGYNTRLSTIEQLCRALDCEPGDLLEISGSRGAEREDR